MISKKIEQRKAVLAELLIEEESFLTRSAELEAALEEAKTEEEISAVEGSVNALDNEKSELETKKSALESEIDELEGELEQLKSKEPTNTPKQPKERQNQIVGGEIRMKVNKGFFRGMERSVADSIIQRQEVKDFLDKIRSGEIPNEKNLN